MNIGILACSALSYYVDAAQKKMDKVGAMKVTNVCQEVMEVFELTGFTDILVIA